MPEEEKKNNAVVATTEQQQSTVQLAKGTNLLEELASTIPAVINAIYEVVRFKPDLQRFIDPKPFWDHLEKLMNSLFFVQSHHITC
jgi:hypothetical protein